MMKSMYKILALACFAYVSLAQDYRETAFLRVSLGPGGNNMQCGGLCALAENCLAFVTSAANPCMQINQERGVGVLCVNGEATCYRKIAAKDQVTTGPSNAPTTVNEPTETIIYNVTEVPSTTMQSAVSTLAPETTPSHEVTTTSSFLPGTCVNTVQRRGDQLIISFHSSDLFSTYLAALMNIYDDIRDSQVTKAEKYSTFPADVLDVFAIGPMDVYTVDGSGIVSRYTEDFGTLKYVKHSSDPLQTVYGNSAPSLANAATAHVDDTKLYLLHGVELYEFSIGGFPNAWTYTFLQQATLTDPASAFPPNVGSVPANVDAMSMSAHNSMLVFAGLDVHTWDMDTGTWTNRGALKCPV